jgi:hypothetical protein
VRGGGAGAGENHRRSTTRRTQAAIAAALHLPRRLTFSSKAGRGSGNGSGRGGGGSELFPSPLSPRTLSSLESEEQAYREAFLNARLAGAWAGGRAPWAALDFNGLELLVEGGAGEGAQAGGEEEEERQNRAATAARRAAAHRAAAAGAARDALVAARGPTRARLLGEELEVEWAHLERLRRRNFAAGERGGVLKSSRRWSAGSGSDGREGPPPPPPSSPSPSPSPPSPLVAGPSPPPPPPPASPTDQEVLEQLFF